MDSPSAPPDPPSDHGEGGDNGQNGGSWQIPREKLSRFELELEFVQSLGNPNYLNHLADRKIITNPAFVAYLDYLQYWTRPPYIKYLTYPAPTLHVLKLLQQERFRREIIRPDVARILAQELTKAAVEWQR